MQRRYLWGIFLIIVLLGTSFYITIADCTPDNDPGDNVVTCDDAPLEPTGSETADGGAGNDTVIVGSASSTYYAYGDNVVGDGGNDTIIVNGLVTTNAYGDAATGKGGDDTIIVNGTVGDSAVGDGVDGVGGDDVIVNNNNVNGSLLGDDSGSDGGDDVIVNNGTVLVEVIGDISDGAGGDDVIINNGVVVGDVRGDTSAGDGGDDIIINNGTIGTYIYADDTGGDGGDDLIINNGSIGDIHGDAAVGNGGGDTIVNNGTMTGSVFGDTVLGDGGDDLIVNNGTVDNLVGDNSQGAGGDDTIINNGTIEGTIQGGAGDDTIIIQLDHSDGGDDNQLVIYGDVGNDTLVFAQLTCAEDGAQTDIAEQLASLNGNTGMNTLVINGQTYIWDSIEELVNLLRQHNCILGFSDGRLNAYDAAAPAVAYCVSDGGLTVYDIDAESQGRMTLTINAETLKASLDAAVKTNQSVLVASDDAGNSLWALPTGEYQLVGANDVEPDKTYFFTFAADRCPA